MTSLRPRFFLALAALVSTVSCTAPRKVEPARSSAIAVPVSPDAAVPAPWPDKDPVQLLRGVAERFGRGITAAQLATLVGTSNPTRSGKGWTVSAPDRHMIWTVVADAATDASSWVIGHPERPMRLRDLAGIFGKYRKLPPGEYTWLRFEAFRPSEVAVSAQVVLAADEPESQVVRVQFQKPQ